MHLILKLVNGEVLEQTVESNVCIIGRSAKCTVVVPHDGMSRQHCQIDVIDGEYFITDLGSTNGVFIDGQRIEANQKSPYQTFLTLSFGAVQSLQIENEEAGGDSLRVQTPRRETTKEGSTGITTLTKTKTMAGPQKTQSQANWKPKSLSQEKTTKSQSMIINVIVVLILAGAVLWYSQKEDAAESDVPVIIDEPQAQPKEPPSKPYESF
jgi:pSer/pThr/pTyr-binding forkhead associated (FHA) protein